MNTPHNGNDSQKIEIKKDVNRSLKSFGYLIRSYDPDKHGDMVDYLTGLGGPAIREAIWQLGFVQLSRDKKMEGIMFPQMRRADHYKVGDRLCYIGDPEDPIDDEYEIRIETVREIDNRKGRERHPGLLYVHFDDLGTAPLRSVRVMSEAELQCIYDNELFDHFKKMLPADELKYLELMKAHICKKNNGTPEKKQEVKNLVDVLLKRNDYAGAIPKKRPDDHYKVGDLVWIFNYDLSDMRAGSDEDYDCMHFELSRIHTIIKSEKIYGSTAPDIFVGLGDKGNVRLRSAGIFSSKEILDIRQNYPFKDLQSSYNDILPWFLERNIRRWETEAEELGIGLADFLRLKEETFPKHSKKRV